LSIGIGFLILARFNIVHDDGAAPGAAPAVAPAEAGVEVEFEPAAAGGVGGIGP
jgi:hypothetical protein